MKIDTSTIVGFDEMTDTDKLNALLEYEYDDGSAEVERYKNAASKANSQAAEWKKKHNELLSADEKASLEKDEAFNQMREELENLKKEKLESEYKAKYLSLGYDEKLAAETAAAYINGDTEKVFANQAKFLEEHDRSVAANQLQGMSRPAAGAASSGITKAEIMKVRDPAKRQRLIQENINLFRR